MAEEFGQWVKERRRAVGLRRQEDLAALVDVTQSAVSDWENGNNFPKRETIPALARALNVTEDDLLARAYDSSYGTVGGLARQQRQMMESINRFELRFSDVVTTMERITNWADQMERALAEMRDLLQQALTAIAEPSSRERPSGGGRGRKAGAL